MIGWRVHQQPIIALYFESESVIKFYNLEALSSISSTRTLNLVAK